VLFTPKAFWITLMSLAGGLYALGLVLCFFSSPPWLGAALLIGILILHLCEIKTALRIGRTMNLPDSRIWTMTLLFGFTWWLPLKLRVFSS